MKVQIAPTWFSSFLEKESVFLTNRETLMHYLGKFYRRMKIKLDTPKVVVVLATAHKLAQID